MSEATIRELRNNGAAVIDRVLSGETITITRDGEPVAELRPLGRRPLSREALQERARKLPPMDPQRLREDIDAIIDPSL
ncbi:MAG: type II toxin-antitoxin system Phd/YefM family antitoxin [Sporichthyaceae bacterium]